MDTEAARVTLCCIFYLHGDFQDKVPPQGGQCQMPLLVSNMGPGKRQLREGT